VRARHPGEHAGTEADAAVTDTPGCTVVVRTADCVPIVVLGHRSVAVVHAGWKGLLAGVVARAADALRDLGDEPRVAHLGPCIRPGCYEFDGPERVQMMDRFGVAAGARTTWDAPALDLPRVARIALAEAGVPLVVDSSGCTACDDRWFSHRARAEAGRFATRAWLAET